MLSFRVVGSWGVHGPKFCYGAWKAICAHAVTFGVSYRDMAYLVPDLENALSWADVVPWLNKLSELASRGVPVMEDDGHRARCHVRPTGVSNLLYGAQPVLAPMYCNPGPSNTHESLMVQMAPIGGILAMCIVHWLG